MQIIESVGQMQEMALAARRAGEGIALVPTMGYLHDGHASLMRAGRARGELLVASIFVNPTQFGRNEDLSTYPRDLARDTRIAEAAGVDLLFLPLAEDIYPPGFQTYVNVEEISLPLCGASRPGHFRGVTTVVCKLFNIVQPTVAFFGKKDFQQLAVIRQMVIDLNMPVTIVGMPIVREPDGLAMSSRNAYLSPDERHKALCLSRGLKAVRTAYRAGERSVTTLRQLVIAAIEAEKTPVIDYAEFRHGTTLQEVAHADDRTLLALAVKIGTTRLIDNCVLGEDD